MKKTTSKKLLTLGGLAALVLFLFNYGRPAVRFRRDAFNKATPAGMKIAADLGADAGNRDLIEREIAWHFRPDNYQATVWKLYKEKGWALSQ